MTVFLSLLRKTASGLCGLMLWVAILAFLPIASSATFPDVTEETQYQSAIEYLADKGIINGYADGSFGPENTLTRAELLKILLEAKEGFAKPNTPTEPCFPDVATTDWYAPYVCHAKAEGIVEGFPDGNFQPNKEVSFVEAAKLVVNSLDYPIKPDVINWYKPYVEILSERKAIPASITRLYLPLTRSEMAEIIYRLKTDLKTETFKSYADLVAVIIPDFLPQMERVPLKTFIEKILQLPVSDSEYNEVFIENNDSKWEINRLGAVQIDGEEKDLYSIYHRQIDSSQYLILESYVGFIKDSTFHYFENVSSVSGLEPDTFHTLKHYSKPIPGISLGLSSSELRSFQLNSAGEKAVLWQETAYCDDELVKQTFGQFEDFDQRFLFDLNNSYSIYQLTDQYFMIKDRMNTCSLYSIYLPYFLNITASGNYQLQIEIDGKEFNQNAYSPYRINCVSHSNLGAIYWTRRFDSYKKSSIITELRKVGQTAEGYKIYVYAENSDPFDFDQWDTWSRNDERYKVGVFLYNKYKTPAYLSNPDSLTSEQQSHLQQLWQDFLKTQTAEYPIIFIEDSSGNLIRFILEKYNECY